MVSLSMMARLVEAVRAEARLVLIGDPGQLTSIEAGAVLGDIVGGADPARDGIVVLDRVHRYGEAIARVADAVRAATPTRPSSALAGVSWIAADAGDPDAEALLAPVPTRSSQLRAASWRRRARATARRRSRRWATSGCCARTAGPTA